jgi:uncharacterized Tic20 family protein
MILHFSLLSGYIIPLAGLVAPIVIWQLKKTEFPEIDDHGKVVINWVISAVIYACVFLLLSFLVIGLPLLVVLGVLCVVFPIVGGIKANNGELWPYPLSIRFLKTASVTKQIST